VDGHLQTAPPDPKLDVRAGSPAGDRRRLARPLGIAAVALPSILIGALSWPLVLTKSGMAGDWEHHLWYIWHQGLAIEADHAASPFLSTAYSVFYPIYTFYGGTLYALTGGLSALLGGAPTVAYVLTYMLAYAAAYGGWYWLGRIAGLGRWQAQAPAILFLTSAPYLTMLYSRGDWTEFVAVSTIPLLAASTVSLLRAERTRPLPAAALAASAVVLFGSHNLTMLWGSTLLVLAAALIIAFVSTIRRALRPRRIVATACILVPAALLNAWFLLPAAIEESHTRIAGEYTASYGTLQYTSGLVSFGHLFTLSRAITIPEPPDFVLALPTLAGLWVLAGLLVALLTARRAPWTRVLSILCALTAAVLLLMTHVGLIPHLPRPYSFLQFSYRLESYALMGLAASVLGALALARDGSPWARRGTWTIVPVLALSVVGAVGQVDAYPRTPQPRSVTLGVGGEVFAEQFNDYGYAPLPLLPTSGLRKIRIPPGAIHHNRLSLRLNGPPGKLADTNIGGGPDLLSIGGARVVGRDSHYQLVLALTPERTTAAAGARRSPRPLRLTIAPAQSVPVKLGALLSETMAVVLVLELGGLAVSERLTASRRRMP
jgi:hypothetical protein